MKRLPRKQIIGHYRVDVILCSQSVIRDALEDDEGGLYHGCWLPDLDSDNTTHGRILILQDLSRPMQWETFWHEYYHAVTDLSGWHKESHQGDA